VTANARARQASRFFAFPLRQTSVTEYKQPWSMEHWAWADRGPPLTKIGVGGCLHTAVTDRPIP